MELPGKNICERYIGGRTYRPWSRARYLSLSASDILGQIILFGGQEGLSHAL